MLSTATVTLTACRSHAFHFPITHLNESLSTSWILVCGGFPRHRARKSNDMGFRFPSTAATRVVDISDTDQLDHSENPTGLTRKVDVSQDVLGFRQADLAIFGINLERQRFRKDERWDT